MEPPRPSPLRFAPLCAAVLAIGYFVAPEQQFPLEPPNKSRAEIGDVRAVAVGRHHACAIDNAGLVRCWGEGSGFQRGDGTRDPSPLPRVVPGIEDAIALSASEDGTCALRRSGAVTCWGTHHAWPRPLTTARDIAGLPSATSLVLGPQHACAISTEGDLWCWGSGIGPDETRASYKPIKTRDGVAAVASGDNHDCVALRTGGVQCWETALYGGKLREIEGVADAVTVGVGVENGCALDRGGRLWCWKQYRGPAEEKYKASPGPVAAARAIAMGEDHSCALGAGGQVLCWGKDDWGQLGERDGGATMGEVSGLGATGIAVGVETSCAALAHGGVACWGDGRSGVLGPAAQGTFPAPARVNGLPPASAIAASWHETCAVSADHALRCWGGPELRRKPDAARPRTEPLSGVESIAMSYPDVCAVTTEGTVWCRGALGGFDKDTSWQPLPDLEGVAAITLQDNGFDKLGYALGRDGRVTAFQVRGEHKAAPIDNLRDVERIAGSGRVCAMTAGRVRCFLDEEIRPGLAAGKTALTPKLLEAPALDGARQLGAGCAVDAKGKLICWGPLLRHGALATYEGGVEGAARFAQSARGTCVVLADGRVSCRGQQGRSFKPVPGLSDVVDIAMGEEHACALKKGGEVLCWGDNEHGAIGQDRPLRSEAPVAIPWEKTVAPAPLPPVASEQAPFVRRRPGCGLTGVDACVYLGCAGPDCLNALVDETDPVRRRYMRRLSDAASRLELEVLAHGEDPGGVPHAEMAMFCAERGPCGKKDQNDVIMDDGYACLTKAEAAHNHGDEAEARAAQTRACHCDPVRAQIPIMGGVLACDGPDKPVERGGYLSLAEAQDIRDCAECDGDDGPRACARELERLRAIDAEQARFVETVQVPRCLEE